jgi:hypothetical protein
MANISRISKGIKVNPSDFVSTYLQNGGSNDMGVDGSTPVIFSYTPPAGKKLITGRMMLYLECAADFDSTKFGNLTALSNGVQLIADGVILETWSDNIDLITTFYDGNAYEQFGKIRRTMAMRWTFTKAAAGISGIKISNQISVKIQDDLSAAGLIFRAKVQGYLEAA